MSSTTMTAQIRLNRVTPSHCRVVLERPAAQPHGPGFVPQIGDIVTVLEDDDRVKVMIFESAVDSFFLDHSELLANFEDLTALARSRPPRGLARRPGAPDARPVRFDRADPGAGDRQRQ